MSDPRNQIPSFDEVMHEETMNGKIPSFADIMGETPKKKESGGILARGAVSISPVRSGGSIVGGINGSSQLQSNGVGSKNDFNEWVGKQTPIEVEGDDDPIGTEIYLQRSKYAPVLYPDNTTGKPSKVNHYEQFKASNELNKNLTQLNNAFTGNPQAANEYMKQTLAKQGIYPKGVEDVVSSYDPNNRTQKLATKAIVDADNIEKAIANSPTFEDAAMTYAEMSENEAGRQAKFLDKEVPNIVKGQFVDNFIHNPNVQALAEHNPEFKQKIDEAANSLYDKFPEYAVKKVRGILGQARENRGMNSLLANNPSVEKTDELAKELLKEGSISEKEYEVWDKNIKPALGIAHSIGGGSAVIPTSDVREGFTTGIEEGVGGIGQSFKHIASLSDTERQNKLTREAIIKQYSDLGVRPKSEVGKIVTTGSHLVGYLAPMLLANAAGSPSMVTNTAMFLGQNWDNAQRMFPGNEAKQAGYTALTTGADVFFGEFLPGASKSVKGELNGEIKSIINQFTEKKITADEAKSTFIKAITNKAPKVLKENAKTAGVLTGFNVIHNAADAAFGGRDISLEEGVSEAIDAFKTNFFAATPLSLMHTVGRNKSTNGEMIRTAVEDPLFEERIKSTENPEVIKNYETAKESWEEIKNLDIPEDKKNNFLLKDLQQKVFEQKSKDAKVSVVKEGWEKKAKEVEIEQKIILDPDISNTEIVQEFYDNELLPKGTMEALEVEGKFNESKVGEFLKGIAQQANNLDANWKPNTDGLKHTQPNLPIDIIEIANERWKKEIEAAQPKQESRISVIRPEDNKPPNIIELKKTEEVAPEEKIVTDETTIDTETNPADKQGQFEPTEESKPSEPPPESGEKTGEAEEIRLSHADTEQIYKEGGLPERLETPTKHNEELKAQADKMIADGYNFNEVADKVMTGDYKFEDVDQVAFAKQVGALKEKQKGLDIKSEEFDKLQNEIEKLSRASDVAGTITGRALQARKVYVPKDETIADYVMTEKEVNQDAPLTDKQKETVQKEFEDIQKAKKDFEEYMANKESDFAKQQAEAAIKKEKPISKKSSTKDYAAERKEIFQSIKDKLKKARGEASSTVVPYAKELISIAPDVAKLVKNLLADGVTRLEDIVKNIHGQLVEDIPELKEKDVHDIIAGVYNEKKSTRNELAVKAFDLRRQAQLVNKLETLLRGEEPKSETRKIRRNQEIEALKKQIKDFENAKNEAQKTPIEKKSPEEIALQSIKTRMKTELEKVEAQLKSGDFSKPEKKEELKLDEEGRKLKDKLIQAKQERALRILKQEYTNRSKWEKTKQGALEVLNVPRTIMSSMDFSAPLRQGLWAGISHPRTMGLAGIEMFKQAFSQKRFDRWFHDLREDPRYKTMEASELYVSDPHDSKLSAKEEAFMNNLAEKIPFVGKLIKGSERAYVGFLNKMRVDLFNRFADRYEEQGRTVENSPELYKKMADYVNNSTGRGKLGPLEDYAPVFNTMFFSPRLMASRINLLTAPFNPNFYRTVPKEIRIMYAKDLFKFLALGTSVLALAKLNGAQVEDDPRSSDFGKIHDKNSRWDIWGGFQPYVRLAAQMVTGERKSTNTGKVQKLDGEGFFGEDRGSVALGFLRGKLAPVPSMLVDFIKKKDAVGNDVTIGSEAESHLLPLLYSDLKEAVKDRGVSAYFTVGLPSIFGVGVNTYTPRESKSSHQRPKHERPVSPKREKLRAN